jgi:hypothetical protein
MTLLENHRNGLLRRREELARLQLSKAKEVKMHADLQTKAERASQTASRSAIPATRASKSRDVERFRTQAANVSRNIAKLEDQIARKQAELASAENRLAREEENQSKKEVAEARRQAEHDQQHIGQIDATLSHHTRLHAVAADALAELVRLPERIVVLFLAANPVDQVSLRLDEEARAIAEMIRKSAHRDSVRFESCWAVRPVDVLQAINEFKPAIVHFSGHGSDRDEIVFQGTDGRAKFVTKEAIVQAMMAAAEGIRLVFFNTCYSHRQAKSVVKHVEAAIGMRTTIGDEAARVFASQFYSAIGFGLSVQQAFEQARALLMMEGIAEEDTPELFFNTGIDGSSVVIVRPPGSEAASEDLQEVGSLGPGEQW